MIYKGEMYLAVSQQDIKVGDLAYISSLGGERCDVHEFVTEVDSEGDAWFANTLPDNTLFVCPGDTFKVYRLAENVKEENV